MGFIKFLGTAGARFVMLTQLRASGGIWIKFNEENILIDPGPGSLIRALNSRPKLQPQKLSGLILTHKHLDHSNDINLMVEAMTEGGFKKRGLLFVPSDALGKGGVIFDYLLNFPEKIIPLKKGKFKIGSFEFEVPSLMVHSVETYGLKFKMGKSVVSLITDTEYFEDLANYYKADILIINVVFLEKRKGIQHLCLEEAEKLISAVKPQKAILTHFGMTMLRAKPHILEESLSKKLGVEVKSAYDGMKLDF
ncbi:MAG TPA: MBL fold metallo-hydrolase [Candidatus Omnitrophica bacterium]|nr:MAG: MBL fold metallo-hydrolase [Candidatus Omnitrophota bacterium]RKY44004.1 MAG: MBL fold metallo-hydrolase [Candidatus Omnitrophota bacterium]HEC69754.1 MBL fold metallo-hydrolase [Candidatus Omnitrophota bacterium]